MWVTVTGIETVDAPPQLSNSSQAWPSPGELLAGAGFLLQASSQEPFFGPFQPVGQFDERLVAGGRPERGCVGE